MTKRKTTTSTAAAPRTEKQSAATKAAGKTSAANVAFELMAPYNDSVKLIGDWNKWQPIPMERGDDGIWRVEVPLQDGEYQYKFEVISKSYFSPGQKVTVPDPCAVRYTLDSRENSVITIKNGQPIVTEYQWQHDDKPLPENQQLIIYELFVADFCGGNGNFNTLIEKLDYLKDLGINAVELLPVNEFPGDHAWGYSIRSLYAVENSYGTPDDLCRLVDECHARGIRVIHDTVYNHLEMEAPLTKIDFSYWFYEQNPDEGALQFGPKFNYEHYDENLKIFPAREHVIGAMHMWIRHFHMDGLRFDATRALKYFDLLSWFNQEAHRLQGFKPFFTIAEHIPQDPTIAGPQGPMDAAWHDNFFRQMAATVVGVEQHGRDPFNTDEVLRLMSVRGDGFASPYNTVHYLSDHDESHIMYLLGAAANTFDDAAFRRAKLGATLLMTAPGIPHIWMGEEFGQPTERSLEPRPMQWDLLQNERNQGLFNHYKMLIALRKNNPALYSENFEPILNAPGRGLIGYKRWNDAGDVMVTVANLTPRYAGQFEINSAGLEDGVWHEMVFNYDVTVEGGRLVDSLAESEAKIYIKS